MKKIVLAIIFLALISYFGLFYFSCSNFPSDALTPRKLNPDHKISFSLMQDQVKIPLNDKDSINGIFFKTNVARPRGIVLFFHEGEGSLESNRVKALTFTTKQFVVIMADYPGYGHSKGVASESGFYDTADAIWDWANLHYPNLKKLSFGKKLGTLPATYLASKHDLKKVILESPYNNLSHLFSCTYSYFPSCSSLENIFPIDSYIEKISEPLHIILAGKSECKYDPIPPKASYTIINCAADDNLTAYTKYHEELDAFLADIILK